MLTKVSILFIFVLMISTNIFAEVTEDAGNGYTSPRKGSPLRTQLLDSVRPLTENQYKEKAIFNVRAIQSNGKLAVLFLEPKLSKTKNPGWIYAIVSQDLGAWKVKEIEFKKEELPQTWKKKYSEIPARVFDMIEVGSNAEVP